MLCLNAPATYQAEAFTENSQCYVSNVLVCNYLVMYMVSLGRIAISGLGNAHDA